ncbi:hypothetical protein OG930_05510 [Streptomyces sp. NBC_01799]|uniref:hypothetical protein n=1 Tax=Streptomyces sp. NBC_01800 TaxID=2975945 RepID=UPI002DD94CDF|nr:hypothetical protein [Streptomyces sp. NBC_01800]WSA66500.1 hypothetical protein OIE65_05575 [Streptomyces sp. NBC_01800]WSA75105.1 hypothetical protein OG930_05510 [Streptomyces sp. NBC_01799]
MSQMPGTVKSARALLLVVAAGNIAGTAISAKLYDGTWGIAVVAGALVIVLSTGQDTRDWFDRPRP